MSAAGLSAPSESSSNALLSSGLAWRCGPSFPIARSSFAFNFGIVLALHFSLCPSDIVFHKYWSIHLWVCSCFGRSEHREGRCRGDCQEFGRADLCRSNSVLEGWEECHMCSTRSHREHLPHPRASNHQARSVSEERPHLTDSPSLGWKHQSTPSSCAATATSNP